MPSCKRFRRSWLRGVMQLIDCHSHSERSGHGQGSVTQMVEAAAQAGLACYCQTEHYPLPEYLDSPRETSMDPATVDDYCLEVFTARDELKARGSEMSVLCGAELDWLDGNEEHTRVFAQACERFEYSLASVHYVDEMPFDFDEDMRAWEVYGADGVWERYLKAWENLVRSGCGFTTLSHPDLPKVLCMLPSFDVRDAFGDLAQLVARQGYAIEVNTAGWRKPIAEQYPAAGVLKLFAQAGVACTVGCDAHKPADVGADVMRAYRVMYDAGYRRVAVPCGNREFRFIELA